MAKKYQFPVCIGYVPEKRQFLAKFIGNAEKVVYLILSQAFDHDHNLMYNQLIKYLTYNVIKLIKAPFFLFYASKMSLKLLNCYSISVS